MKFQKNVNEQFKGKTGYLFYLRQFICAFLSTAMLLANIPISVSAAVDQRKYIYSENFVFVPLLGEAAEVKWNLQNRHVINIYIMSGDEIIRTLAEDEEFTGGYVQHETTWDGKDSEGDYVPAGTYRFVVEPQDKYIRHKSVTEIYVVDDLTKDVHMLPNLEGNSYVLYGNEGKKKGIRSASLSITEDGRDIADVFTADVKVGDHIWYTILKTATNFIDLYRQE